MTENNFEELWQKMETERYSQKLAAEFPRWKRNRQRAVSLLLMLLVVVAATLITITSLKSPSPNFEKVYCNRVGISDTQWVTLATEMLLE